MRLLAHRGLWKNDLEKNTLVSFKSAFKKGYGIETDIRDRNGELVISHNPPDKSAPLFTELLDAWKESESKALLALNIKADGMYLLIGDIFKDYGIEKGHYFFFDASLPEQYIYLKRGYNIFTRSSEFEKRPAFFEESRGVWLDQFTDCAHIRDVLPELLASGKTVSVVSPELHKRDKAGLWEFIKQYESYSNLILCTDLPEEAEGYFNVEN